MFCNLYTNWAKIKLCDAPELISAAMCKSPTCIGNSKKGDFVCLNKLDKVELGVFSCLVGVYLIAGTANTIF